MTWTDDAIRQYWSDQAREHGGAPTASWSDVRVLEMEVREILTHLQDGDQVLDVGCANGCSTLQFARAKAVDLVGVDYIPGMIEHARGSVPGAAGSLRGKVRFEVADAQALPFAADSFDKAVVIRVIINLGSWQRQRAALQECLRVLRPGGTLILSEATRQGWERLNRLRGEWGLPPIPMPGFNNYLDEDRVRQELAATCEFVGLSNYASTYYVGTRVLKPLLAKAAGREDQVANPLCELNRWFSLLPAAGDYGTQKMFFFRKRER